MAVIKIGCLHNVIGFAAPQRKPPIWILIKCHISRRKCVEHLAIYSHGSCPPWTVKQVNSEAGENRWGRPSWVSWKTFAPLLFAKLPRRHSPLIHLPLNKFTRHETLHTTRGSTGLDGTQECLGGRNTSNHSTRHRLNTCETIRSRGGLGQEVAPMANNILQNRPQLPN